MHELSIALSILDLAGEEARKAEASVITRVEVEIGTLSGVETEALLFAWESARGDTPASGAELVIHTIQAEATCRECGKVFPVVHLFAQCPHCHSFRYEITKGREMKVTSLMVE